MQPLIFRNEHSALQIQLLKAEDDPYLNISVSSHGFSGQNDLYVFGEEFKHFCASLRSLETTLHGEAVLESMSPNELKIRLSNANSRGHIAVEGSTGYWVGVGEAQFWHSVTFGFIVEPLQLSSAVALPWIREA